MQFRVTTGVSVILSWCVVVGALAACSASDTTTGGVTSSGATGGTAGSSSGGSIGLGGMGGSAGTGVMLGGNGGAAGTSTQPGAWIPTDLPAPWAYYNDGTDRAYKESTLGDNVKDLFSGAPTTDADLKILYPLDNTMHPVNASQMRFQWHRGATTNSLFRIDAVGEDGKTSRFYVSGTHYRMFAYETFFDMPESDWLWLGADYAGKSVTITISATDGAGGPVATSAPIKAYFSPEPVYGSLYYWAAAQEELKRANFGAKQAVPFVSPESQSNEFKCVACHSVSRNGKVAAFAVSNIQGESVAAIQTAPTEDPSNPYVRPTLGTTPYTAAMAHADPNVAGDEGSLDGQPTDHFGQIAALNPDGSIVAINGTNPPDGTAQWLELRNATTGETIVKYNRGDAVFGGGDRIGIHPEFSPDGNWLLVALTRQGDPCEWTYVTCAADIAALPVMGGNSLGTAVTIATNADANTYNFYPSWSPDGAWVAFMTGNKSADAKSIFAQNSVMHLVSTSGGPYACPGPSCYELKLGTQYGTDQYTTKMGRHSTWPKFTPFAQGANKNIMFISMTSGIDYGWFNQAKENGYSNYAYARNQIWMFAVDVSKVGQGDISYAPIWLPQQDYADGSLNPYWTETLPCQSDPGGACTGCVAGEECHVSVDNQCECRAVAVK